MRTVSFSCIGISSWPPLPARMRDTAFLAILEFRSRNPTTNSELAHLDQVESEYADDPDAMILALFRRAVHLNNPDFTGRAEWQLGLQKAHTLLELAQANEERYTHFTHCARHLILSAEALLRGSSEIGTPMRDFRELIGEEPDTDAVRLSMRTMLHLVKQRDGLVAVGPLLTTLADEHPRTLTAWWCINSVAVWHVANGDMAQAMAVREELVNVSRQMGNDQLIGTAQDPLKGLREEAAAKASGAQDQ